MMNSSRKRPESGIKAVPTPRTNVNSRTNYTRPKIRPNNFERAASARSRRLSSPSPARRRPVQQLPPAAAGVRKVAPQGLRRNSSRYNEWLDNRHRHASISRSASCRSHSVAGRTVNFGRTGGANRQWISDTRTSGLFDPSLTKTAIFRHEPIVDPHKLRRRKEVEIARTYGVLNRRTKPRFERESFSPPTSYYEEVYEPPKLHVPSPRFLSPPSRNYHSRRIIKEYPVKFSETRDTYVTQYEEPSPSQIQPEQNTPKLQIVEEIHEKSVREERHEIPLDRFQRYFKATEKKQIEGAKLLHKQPKNDISNYELKAKESIKDDIPNCEPEINAFEGPELPKRDAKVHKEQRSRQTAERKVNRTVPLPALNRMKLLFSEEKRLEKLETRMECLLTFAGQLLSNGGRLQQPIEKDNSMPSKSVNHTSHIPAAPLMDPIKPLALQNVNTHPQLTNESEKNQSYAEVPLPCITNKTPTQTTLDYAQQRLSDIKTEEQQIIAALQQDGFFDSVNTGGVKNMTQHYLNQNLTNAQYETRHDHNDGHQFLHLDYSQAARRIASQQRWESVSQIANEIASEIVDEVLDDLVDAQSLNSL